MTDSLSEPLTTDERVGRNVRQVRENRGLTQRELANRLRAAGWQIDTTALTRIENGSRSLRVAQLDLIATALESSIFELVEDERHRMQDMQMDAHSNLVAARRELVTALNLIFRVVNHAKAFEWENLAELGQPDVTVDGYPDRVAQRVAEYAASKDAEHVQALEGYDGASVEQMQAIANALVSELFDTGELVDMGDGTYQHRGLPDRPPLSPPLTIA
ncbi:helix-turn-helix domain-containing protein [Isoptericola sp. NPDC060257]|uniref:helix-turn-helix domain-containing protein n=1 Tax=Isoptericola sp. NPDC060257 TaxID=3347087 RepID=UPI00366969CA